MEALHQTIFYVLEKSIKSYRQFAQRNIDDYKLNITIDQWLVLRMIQEHPDISQVQLAEKVFKDYASITRILDLLVSKKFLTRTPHPNDRRRWKLQLSKKGLKTIEKLEQVVEQNRKTALKGITKNEIRSLQNTLNKIIHNCT